MTFYLKYRPKNIDELDIDVVRNTLQKIVDSKNFPHAFLFAGPKGTGKTSMARIVAKAINCEAGNICNKCEQCLSITAGNNIDVIEMDAASNRGIDDIRALRDVVKLAPGRAKAKIYIIDEAHMLTTEASNALLKTLEEPPTHVYFILATTNPEKLIETIKSRTLMIQFQKASETEMKRSLTRIIKGEEMKIDENSLNKIVKRAKGSFRDGAKLLEQYSKDPEFINNIVDLDTSKLMEITLKLDLDGSVSELERLISCGLSSSFIYESLVENLSLELNKKIQQNEIADTAKLIEFIELLLKLQQYSKYSPIDSLPIELAIATFITNQKSNIDSSKEPEDKRIKEQRGLAKIELEAKEDIKKKVEKAETIVAPDPNKKLDPIFWEKILKEVKPINSSIEALLRSSKPVEFDGEKLMLGVYYKFHKDKLDEYKNKKIVEDVTGKVFSKDIRIECFITNEEPPKIELTEVKNENIMKVAEEIFS